MTQDEIKKGLEYAAKVTGNGVFAGAYKIITEQEIEIERLKEETKQAQIDVLNELKTQLKAKEQHYICMYDWDGHTAVVDCANEVDELIKEVENDKCNC